MGNYWSIHLPDLLADNGTIAAYSPRGLRLAKYWTEIVVQASNYDEPMWIPSMCCGFAPVCDDNGRISGREGRLWVGVARTSRSAGNQILASGAPQR
jgi:hypothetical protein